MTGANGTITFAKCNRTFLLRRLETSDYGQLAQWAMDKLTGGADPYEKAAKRMKEFEHLATLAPNKYAEWVDKWLVQADREAEAQKDYNILSDKGKLGEVILKHNGLAFLAWLGLRHDAPDVTPEQVAEWMRDDPVAVDTVTKKFLANDDPPNPTRANEAA